jgi:hypothetical protein
MKNKAYFIKQLCKLRNLDPEGEEAGELEDMKIVDILIEIKREKESRGEKVDSDGDGDGDGDVLTFSRRAGCKN